MYLVQDANTEQILACKIMKGDQNVGGITEHDVIKFIEEANLQSNLNDENIARC